MLETPSMQQYETPRDNLFAADNQQGRPMELEPSTTIRTAPKKRWNVKDNPGYYFDEVKRVWMRIVTDTEAYCNNCETLKPLDSFGKTKGKVSHTCKACRRLVKASHRYGISQDYASRLYSARVCECCGEEFEKQTHKHIHRVGSKVKGIVCLRCNHTLRDCSAQHLKRLKCCVQFIKRDEDRV